MNDKRKHPRRHFAEPFTLVFPEEAKIIDINLTGMGVIFMGEECYRDKIIPKYHLPKTPKSIKSLECHVIWRSQMDFYDFEFLKSVTRLGLAFMDPSSPPAIELCEHLGLRKCRESENPI